MTSKQYFFLITDCINLGGNGNTELDEAIGERFDSLEELDKVLYSASHSGISNSDLPLYRSGIQIKPNQLYQTDRMLNHHCCGFYVFSTFETEIRVCNNQYLKDKYSLFHIDEKLLSKIFTSRTVREKDEDCLCYY